VGSKPRILCVDDDARFINSLAQVLRGYDFDVQVVPAGKFALGLLRLSNFDVIIADLDMPGGIRFVHEVRRRKPQQRLILTSESASSRIPQRMARLSTLHYITKPFSVVHLLELINDALKRNTGGLCGSIQLTCEELIQLYAFGQRTATLHIRGDRGSGCIYFENGNPVHATAGELEGEAAFYEIQSWRAGTFTALPFDAGVKRTIARRADALLLEGARKQDEYWRRMVEELTSEYHDQGIPS